jgi:tetratricopeptide (TPR) repeat protein
MNKKHFLTAAYLWVGTTAFGCAGIQVGQQVQAGRFALQTGHPDKAAGYLMQAADKNPDYQTPFRLPQSVLGYLGRAYYETGRDVEAKSVLELAVNKNRDDHLAQLYLGLIHLQNGDSTRGRTEVETALRGIHETLEYLAADNINGIFWDPARRLRANIEQALMSNGNLPLFVASAEQIGRDFDDEMDTARRDEGRHRNGRGGGGGD